MKNQTKSRYLTQNLICIWQLKKSSIFSVGSLEISTVICLFSDTANFISSKASFANDE